MSLKSVENCIRWLDKNRLIVFRNQVIIYMYILDVRDNGWKMQLLIRFDKSQMKDLLKDVDRL